MDQHPGRKASSWPMRLPANSLYQEGIIKSYWLQTVISTRDPLPGENWKILSDSRAKAASTSPALGLGWGIIETQNYPYWHKKAREILLMQMMNRSLKSC